jgi:hypothetical protein
MLKKTQKQQYIKIIMDHLKGSQSDNFEQVCREISEIQKLSNIGKKKLGGTTDAKSGKEVVLASADIPACKTCGKRPMECATSSRQLQVTRVRRSAQVAERKEYLKLTAGSVTQTKLLLCSRRRVGRVASQPPMLKLPLRH